MEEKPPLGNLNPKRILAIDMVRGIGIFGVLFIHPMIYGVWHSEALALSIVPSWVVALFAPFIIMGTWGGGFPMISAFAFTYNTYNRLEQGYSFKSVAIPTLITSTFIFILDPIRQGIFGRTWTHGFKPGGYNYSVMSRLFELGTLDWPSPENPFQFGSLPAIAISGYVTVFILWLLFRNGHHKDRNRNIWAPILLGLILILISNTLNELLYGYIPILFEMGGFYRVCAYFLRVMVGSQLSYFPIGIYAFFGISFGYLLAIRVDYKSIRRIGFLLGFGFLVAFMLLLGIKIILAPGQALDVIFGILDYEIYPRELLFISLGCMCLLYVWVVKRFEYIWEDLKLKRIKRTRFFRRFGTATLSLYFLEPICNGLLAYLFHWIFGTFPWVFEQQDPFMTNFLAILLFVATFLGFWILFSIGWEKIGYKYGFEYWLARATAKHRKVPSLRLTMTDQTEYFSPSRSHL